MKKQYLVTGCAGFIGSKVAEMLLAEGHVVVGVDSLNDAYDPRLKHWRLAQLKSHPDFRFRGLDITDRTALEQLFADDAKRPEDAIDARPYSAVINLAARAGVRPSVENPWIYFETNTSGTLNLLDLCRRFEVGKFLLASTSSLYGSHNPVPFREDTDTDRPLSPYAASKKGAEALAHTYHHLHGIDVTIPRYFTVYGPAGRPDMSVFRFIRRIAEDEPIIVFGDGRQSRDFTYVDDIARGTIAALRPLGFEVVNLGGDHAVELAYIIDRIGEILGKTPKIDYGPFHPADVRATSADISKARELLGFEPQVSIEEGLRRSVDWYLEHREIALPLELGDRIC
jgi:nucleoside-diphosphate-sugar epimerase